MYYYLFLFSIAFQYSIGALLDIHGSNSEKRIKIESNLKPNDEEINTAASANAVPS